MHAVVSMGCGASKVLADMGPLQEELARARAELKVAQEQLSRRDAEVARLQLQQTRGEDEGELKVMQQQLAQRDAEIARLQVQQLTGKGGELGPSTEAVQRFLTNKVPAIQGFLETAKKHGLRNTGALESKIAELQRDASTVKDTVEQYQKQLCVEGKRIQHEVSEIEKRLDLSKWLEEDFTALTSCEFKVVRADKLRSWSGGPLPRHQELMGKLGAGSLQTIRISVRDLFCGSAALKSILVVSHRWVEPGCPDPEGKQQAVIVEYLKSNPEIEFVWEDYWCIPQGRRSQEEQDYFEKTLEHVYMLFLGARVLLLLDMQYLGRFWTSYEAWLSMHFVNQEGFHPGDDRVTIRCLGAAGVMEQSLRDTWGPLTIEQARANLSEDDIIVTNRRDKEQQLKVLQQLSSDLPNLISLLSQVSQVSGQGSLKARDVATKMSLSSLQWHAQNHGSYIEILNGGKTAKAQSGHTAAVADVKFTAGVNSFSVRVDSVDLRGHTGPVIGVAPESFQAPNNGSPYASIWGYCYQNGQKRNRNSVEQYGHGVKAGDIVTVRYDAGKKSIEFLLNDKSLGLAHHDVMPPVVPAITFYDPASFTIV